MTGVQTCALPIYYHEISRRFYDGLPELPTVTLVAQSMAHPAIVEHFPGPVRLTRSHFLTRLLGNLAPQVTPIRDGATVAHLSFYLAQHLGCDPIIFIGQDLGFSDGLYYCPGTAIHEVWAPELNAHNTLEMMEWQRIVRHRNHLSKATDIHGRIIYSDEQMTTYLKQFERDFAAAPQKLLDASEGGVAKARAEVTTLKEALAQHATRPVPPLPLPPRELDAKRLAAAAALMGRRIDEVRELHQLSDDALPILRQMLEHQRDEARMEKLFARIDKIKRRVEQLDEMFNLVNEINTLGAFRRARTDRAIHHGSDDEFSRQQKRIERDLDNIEWLAQACGEVQQIFAEAQERLRDAVRKKD